MAISTATLELYVRLRDEATKNLANIEKQVGSLDQQVSLAQRSMGMLGKFTAAAVVGGIGAFAAGTAKAAWEGLSFNSTLEQTRARINAFTKDAGATEHVLDMIRDRAAKTPFAFNEMSASAAGLMSTARSANIPLEDLIGTAEILAASNPMQGLEGSTYALREALGGDFLSLVDRFDIPRQMINDLKDQGLPNIEIVRQAMQHMGLDADLVANMAETASGRWSTFKDTLQGFAATATEKLFQGLSGGLGNVNDWLRKNEAQFNAVAEVIGTKLGAAFTWLVDTGLPKAADGFRWVRDTVGGLIDEFALLLGLDPGAWVTPWEGLPAIFDRLLDPLRSIYEPIK